ncbi:MAG: hypothetical protein IKZ09_07825, partial [Clostridia bacterium]|nr:hypothetical protein [Clostridia bacterium]
MMLKNATARVLSAQSISEYAYQIAGVKLNMSVPVYVMPEDKVPQEIKAMNLADGRLDHLVAPASASEDETARIEMIVSFAEDVIDAATHYTTEPTVLVKQAE